MHFYLIFKLYVYKKKHHINEIEFLKNSKNVV